MFADNIGLHLAGAAADGGRKTVEIGALPETALARLVITHIQAAGSALQVNRQLRMRRVISEARSLWDRGREPG